MYQYKWIEGEKNLEDFCLKCLGERPRFLETIGHCGQAVIWLVYKYRPDRDCYTDMYLLFIDHPKGQYTFEQIWNTIRKMTYEQIEAYRISVLKQ